MKYIGKGSFIASVPARDLSEEEVKKFGKDMLIKSGLYIDEKKEVAIEKPQKSYFKEKTESEE